MKTLPPQHLTESYWKDVEAQLKSAFYSLVFMPIMGIIKQRSKQGAELPSEIRNAQGNMSSLVSALRSGRIQYLQGKFFGEFNVSISKELRSIGATFDQRERVYRLDPIDVPSEIRIEAENYQTTAREAHDEMFRRLNEIQGSLERRIEDLPIDSDSVVRAIEKGWKQSAKMLEVQPELSKEATERLAKDYTKNLKLYIEDFSKKSVIDLREAVEENALEGYRFDSLIEKIRHRYGVTANKARFLARQETGLFMSKYRRERFSDAGVKRYKWSTSHDERVRKAHAELNGRTFLYSDPPITDPATGAHNNPGEDYNCRCVDIPLLEIDPSFK